MRILHRCPLEARSYELDAFGHLNHAVYLNYFEHARFQTLSAHGIHAEEIRRRGEGVHVVRVEVDYKKEVRQGTRIEIRTALESFRKTSMTFRQLAADPESTDTVYAEARVVAVWIGPDGRPMRIPDSVRAALGGA
ncbi:MAG TPA: thioesterase family protein [Longimicrobiales bacterium]|nr:thioesterase family protein [Longimicrobiales bacterium]